MTKPWIIIISVLIFLILLGVGWWYLLMNGRPDTIAGFPNPFGAQSDEIFTPPELGITDEPRAFETSLRKLTTSPVAGAAFVEVASTTHIRYVERGTGHIFEADPETGETERIVGTTIPRTIDATWSSQGTRLALITETVLGEPRVFTGAVARNDEGSYELALNEIDSNAKNIAFTPEGESLHYSVAHGDGTVGYRHDLRTNGRTTVFSTPLRELRVASWDPLITYTAPTALFPGYAYAGSSFERLFGGQHGLTLTRLADTTLVSSIENGAFVSRINTPTGGGSAITIFPDKCAADAVHDGHLWCAAPLSLPRGSYPDDWYRGTVSLSDIVWQLNLRTGNAAVVSIPFEDAREEIDAIGMRANDTGDLLLFMNKRDGALWLQETKE